MLQTGTLRGPFHSDRQSFKQSLSLFGAVPLFETVPNSLWKCHFRVVRLHLRARRAQCGWSCSCSAAEEKLPHEMTKQSSVASQSVWLSFAADSLWREMETQMETERERHSQIHSLRHSLTHSLAGSSRSSSNFSELLFKFPRNIWETNFFFLLPTLLQRRAPCFPATLFGSPVLGDNFPPKRQTQRDTAKRNTKHFRFISLLTPSSS